MVSEAQLVVDAVHGRGHPNSIFILGLDISTQTRQEAKKKFKICESRAAKYELPLLNVYGWLARTCKLLGEIAESQPYAQLARAQ